MWKKREEALLVLIFSTKTNYESMAYWSLNLSKFEARGVKKVTKGIISLWLPNIHNNLFFFTLLMMLYSLGFWLHILLMYVIKV